MSQPTSSPEPQSAAAKLFDLRVLIGGLFTLYGILLIVAGLEASAAATRKASGINLNLWMGLGMLVLGVLFLLWWRLRPLRARPPTRSARTISPGRHVAAPQDAGARRRSSSRPEGD